MKRIFVALDGSPRAPKVLEAATRLAELAHARLVLYRAITVSPDLPREVLVETDRRLEDILVGNARDDLAHSNRSLPIDDDALDAVVLFHAHLDHSGASPVLAHHGYRGPIYATPATRDLCAPMLEDAASVQLADARHIDRVIARGVDLESAALRGSRHRRRASTSI
jgi:predicted metal-dependent RNase